jgi:hypothetical protein
VDFYLFLEKSETGSIKVLQLNYFYCISLQLFSHFYSLVNTAAVSFSKNFIKEYLVFSNFDPFISLFEASKAAILCTGAMTVRRSSWRPLEQVFLFS